MLTPVILIIIALLISVVHTELRVRGLRGGLNTFAAAVSEALASHKQGLLAHSRTLQAIGQTLFGGAKQSGDDAQTPQQPGEVLFTGPKLYRGREG